MKNNKSVTAVEWLFEQLDVVDSSISYELFKQAKQMEKEQIMEAVIFGDERGIISTYLTAEQYYNTTFKSE